MEKNKKNKKSKKNILYNIITWPKYFIIGIKLLFDEEKQEELNMEDRIIPIIVTTLSIITYLMCVFLITRWYVQNERNQKFAKSLTEEINEITNEENKQTNNSNNNTNNSKYNYKYPDDLSFLNVNLNPYIRINSETVAWIQVNGTGISYPVVKHKDNNYYLNHDFYKRKTDVGAIFADYRDNFDILNNNNIIYGHNIINQTMFGQLPRVLKKSWQSNKNNHYIKLSTKKTNTIWKVFSTYEIVPTTDYLQSIFYSNETYNNFLQKIKNRSTYNFNTNVKYEDKIITLSTCNNSGTKRVVVHAKLVNLEKK
ncbi:MAG: class B sortase [Bacilli bacterium]|nr:class B sortase [Bacilli bacterium]